MPSKKGVENSNTFPRIRVASRVKPYFDANWRALNERTVFLFSLEAFYFCESYSEGVSVGGSLVGLHRRDNAKCQVCDHQ